MPNSKRRRLTTTSPATLTTPCEARKPCIPNPACTSCRRALTQVYFILCSRCSAPTCVVCSRTCDTSDHPPSNPSPPMAFPRRVAALAANTNSPVSSSNNKKREILGKRRKYTDDSATADADTDDGCLKPQQNNVNARSTNVNDVQKLRCNTERQLHRNHLSSGCGRVICRNCCFENSQNNTITCHDCRKEN